MHVVSFSDGQVLKTRTIARLIREDQLNAAGNSKLLLMSQVQTSRGVDMIRCCSKISLRSYVSLQLQQKNNVKHESAESDSQVVHSSLFQNQWLHQPRERLRHQQQDLQNHLHLQQTFRTPSRTTSTSADQEKGFGRQAPAEFEINMINSLEEGSLDIN